MTVTRAGGGISGVRSTTSGTNFLCSRSKLRWICSRTRPHLATPNAWCPAAPSARDQSHSLGSHARGGGSAPWGSCTRGPWPAPQPSALRTSSWTPSRPPAARGAPSSGSPCRPPWRLDMARGPVTQKCLAVFVQGTMSLRWTLFPRDPLEATYNILFRHLCRRVAVFRFDSASMQHAFATSEPLSVAVRLVPRYARAMMLHPGDFVAYGHREGSDTPQYFIRRGAARRPRPGRPGAHRLLRAVGAMAGGMLTTGEEGEEEDGFLLPEGRCWLMNDGDEPSAAAPDRWARHRLPPAEGPIRLTRSTPSARQPGLGPGAAGQRGRPRRCCPDLQWRGPERTRLRAAPHGTHGRPFGH